MPVVGPVLGQLIQQKVNSRMQACLDYSGPLGAKDPSYFKTMCNAVGSGIATGIPALTFTTTDTGQGGTPPIPGVGSGTGITMDPEYLAKQLYTAIKSKVVAAYGSSQSEDWPVPSGGKGKFAEALCRGIAEAITEHFGKVWILTSVHPLVYAGSGTIAPGGFKGAQAQLIKSSILAAAPSLAKGAWPMIAEALGEAVAGTISLKATGKVSINGICVPGPTQICGLPIPGTGTGSAA